MFNGIVEEMGVIKQMSRATQSAQVAIMAKTVLDDLKVGESVSINGVCLTVISIGENEFSVDLSTQTQNITSLKSLQIGDGVNLERAMRFGGRLGGHLVTGHVDGVGTIRHRRQEENTIILSISAPPEVLRYCVKRGSIAVDGISLTMSDLSRDQFDVAVIPHTAHVTTLGMKGIGGTVNLEADLIGKYVERMLENQDPPSKITREYLSRKGML